MVAEHNCDGVPPLIINIVKKLLYNSKDNVKNLTAKIKMGYYLGARFDVMVMCCKSNSPFFIIAALVV